MYRRDSQLRAHGHTLVEVLVAVAITLIVMALALPMAANFRQVYERESVAATDTSQASRAFSDIIHEVRSAGYGLGDGVGFLLAEVPGVSNGDSSLTIRSNPSGLAAPMGQAFDAEAQKVRVRGTDEWRGGELVLLVDGANEGELALVSNTQPWASGLDIELEAAPGLAAPSGEYRPARGARLLGLREVGYALEQTSPTPLGNFQLVKYETNRPPRILAYVDELRFEYFGAEGDPIAATSLVQLRSLVRRVRLTMAFRVGSDPPRALRWVTSVTLGDQVGQIPFAFPGYGARLTNTYVPIEGAVGVVSQPYRDWGVIVAAGHDANQDPSYLYTLLSVPRPLEARMDSVTLLYDVRGAGAVSIAPSSSRWANGIFIVTHGFRGGELFRLDPDRHGVYSPESPLTKLGSVGGLSEVSGVGFGADGHLYAASSLEGRLLRIRLAADGASVDTIETLANYQAELSSLVGGIDGAITYAVNRNGFTEIWQVAFGAELAPDEPRMVQSFDGQAKHLSVDPLTGQILVLMRERFGDELVLRLPRRMGSDGGLTEELFRLSKLRRETLEGPDDAQIERVAAAAPVVMSLRLPVEQLPDALDFVSMDSLGFMYIGAREKQLVMQFDLDRPDDQRHAVRLSATIVPDESGAPGVQLHAWKAKTLGY